MHSSLEASVDLEQVQCVNPLQESNWDALLSTHPDATFFHSAEWAKVLNRTYGFVPTYFTVLRQDKLLALLPVMEVNSALTGRRGIALPFTDACAPLDHDGLVKQVILPTVLKFGRKRRWKHFECRGGLNVFEDALAYQKFFIHELKLFRDEQYLFSRLDSSTRRAIRKVENTGATIEVSQTLESLRNYYSLHCKTRRKHGLPPQSFTFFQNIQEQVFSLKKGIVILVRRADAIIAGAVFFNFNDRAIYKFGASDENFQEFRGNNLVMWSAIKWYAGKGMKALNFGRTSITNEGLRRFKSGWGAEEKQSEYVKYDFGRERYLVGKDGAAGWYNSVFRALPLFASRMIGASLYRHIA